MARAHPTPAEIEDALHATLAALEEIAHGGRVTVGEMIARLGGRAYGPLMVLLGLLVVLPTGMIPGVPALVGLGALALGLQMLTAHPSPWLPRRLREIELGEQRVARMVARWLPRLMQIRRVLRPRMTLIAEGAIGRQIAGLAAGLAGLIMVPLGFIPFLPFVLGLALVIIGLALAARDGLAMLAGCAVFVPAGWILLGRLLMLIG
ncbi:Uncharacterized conserved protein [Meinhardsimonia xiamenensis]|jgi:hypothetical protein|uniref:Uncharacterized conserved protein n=1 Tax=Meinhardsimonia xiamenensis TaxID=990712 RepID=A0A1G9AN06_9RHOB|nr:exopolysaccharide biosynthesis protein [Meinhardsimonia xiamenensis]PRX35329.1 hypothetical protein LV81_01926 [Meinhardsimonia xiamenensis]SDK28204.1 Uncharacterized conserved protein [Meinhardsimonia xiamenensis]